MYNYEYVSTDRHKKTHSQGLKVLFVRLMFVCLEFKIVLHVCLEK